MFRRLHKIEQPVTFFFDGKPMQAARGQSLASALLAAGVETFRTSVVGNKPRAPYCMMGVCFECLVTVDGISNCQSCLIEVQDGMNVRSQHGAVSVIMGDVQ